MNVKEYLNQTLQINQEIDVMTERLKELRSLASKATATVTDMPSAPTRKHTRLEDVVLKIVAQEEAIDMEIDRLISLREEIAELIHKVSGGKSRRVLQLRYLCCMSWCDVASKMRLNLRYAHRLHDAAVKELDKIFQNRPPKDMKGH